LQLQKQQQPIRRPERQPLQQNAADMGTLTITLTTVCATMDGTVHTASIQVAATETGTEANVFAPMA
ncbi:hypothetical protein DPMN_186407, partial [Dreissena polymorpha]